MKKSLTLHDKHYRIAVILSAVSVIFGILREFLIVGFLGFSAGNDRLQLYLSVFYTIGLSIDAMRLATLNLYSVLSLHKIVVAATLIGLPFSIIVGVIMSYSTGGLYMPLLIITIAGSYLNLIAALLITYLQRHDLFLPSQLINVMPNIILIPGILLCYYFFPTNLIVAIVCLASFIPIVQCLALLFLLQQHKKPVMHDNKSLVEGLLTFVRHFAAMVGEQSFQIIARSTFYHYGAGYLSVYSMVIRIYSAVRFILIDSFIGSKLSHWHKDKSYPLNYLMPLFNSTLTAVLIAAFALLISIKAHHTLIYSSIQMIVILVIGFYFSTLVRLVYFKINHEAHHSPLVIRFAIYELVCAISAFMLTLLLNYPILAILWIGYIAKPFAQLLLLRKRYQAMEFSG